MTRTIAHIDSERLSRLSRLRMLGDFGFRILGSSGPSGFQSFELWIWGFALGLSDLGLAVSRNLGLKVSVSFAGFKL